jgi:hypothetical protein
MVGVAAPTCRSRGGEASPIACTRISAEGGALKVPFTVGDRVTPETSSPTGAIPGAPSASQDGLCTQIAAVTEPALVSGERGLGRRCNVSRVSDDYEV